MKINYLFPNKFKYIGMVMLIPSLILGILYLFFDFQIEFLDTQVPALFSQGIFNEGENSVSMIKNNLTDEVASISFLISTIFLAFSKEKFEDEYIVKVRLESLVWAVYVNYGILFICLIFIYDFSFLLVLIFNLFTVLIFFNLRYYLKLFQLKNQLKNEE